MDSKRISVVIPTYNYGHFVTEAVDSVLAQTAPPLEVIVVDDGSKDDTRQRLARYGDRIRYIYQENQGLSAARNTGIRAAQGEYIALLDSDDVWHPRKLEVQAHYLARHPEVGLLASADIMDRSGGWPAVEAADPAPQPIRFEDLVIKARFVPSGVVIRQDCFRAAGLFDTELRSTEDRDMWIRIARQFPVVKLRVPLVWYRVHGGNMSYVATRMEENGLKVLRKAFRTGAPRLSVRLQALSHIAYSVSYLYYTADMPGRALARTLKSMLLWPLPYRRDEVHARLARPKRLVMICLRLLRARRGAAVVPAPRAPVPVAPAAETPA
jgi:glycosyltransferase involved in cell wall biosynthesis